MRLSCSLLMRSGVDVGQPSAGHAGFEVGKAFFGDVEGVDSAFVCHLRADGEGFAACACAEIDDDFAAFGTNEQGEELAASSWTSSVPSKNNSCLLRAILFFRRMPQGE